VELVLFVAALALFAVLAAVSGVDTRDADDWIVHRSA
jgi:hypothetical protein